METLKKFLQIEILAHQKLGVFRVFLSSNSEIYKIFEGI